MEKREYHKIRQYASGKQRTIRGQGTLGLCGLQNIEIIFIKLGAFKLQLLIVNDNVCINFWILDSDKSVH